MSEEEKTIENLRKNKGVSFAEADIILNLIEEQQKEIDKQNKVIDEIRCEFLKYDWKNSNNKQVYNQLKSLYNAIFRKVEENDNRTS